MSTEQPQEQVPGLSLSDNLLKILAAVYASGYRQGVAAAEGGFVDDPEREAAEWIESQDAQALQRQAGVIERAASE